MITKRRAALAAGIAAALAGAVFWGTMTTAASAGPAFSPSQIAGLARAIVAKNGDNAPTLIQHATGARADANRIGGGDVVFSDQPSYLIVVHGHFTVTPQLPPIPPGVSIPPQPQTLTYSTMTLVVDASTGQVTDYGLTNDHPDLSALGTVTTDASSSAASGG
jgi:hypothetical protein